jgi:hypothetical protein
MSARHEIQHALAALGAFAAANLPMVAGAIGGAALVSGITVALWSGEPSQAATAPAPMAADAVQPAAATHAAATPCEQQTWPYLSAECVKGGAATQRRVRVVSTEQAASKTAVPPAPGRAAPAAAAAQRAAAPYAVAPPEKSYTAVTVRDGRRAARKLRRQEQQAAGRRAKSYAIVAGRPVDLHSAAPQHAGRALAYGEEERPPVVIVPTERGFFGMR